MNSEGFLTGFSVNEKQAQPPQPPQQQQQQQTEVRLVDIPVNDENTALNLMANFLTLAQKRGAFSFEEAAKIWECIRKFQR